MVLLKTIMDNSFSTTVDAHRSTMLHYWTAVDWEKWQPRDGPSNVLIRVSMENSEDNLSRSEVVIHSYPIHDEMALSQRRYDMGLLREHEKTAVSSVI